MLPEALKRGLADLDEQAVAALGFEHLVFLRSAQPPPQLQQASAAQRLAHWMLSQLHFMIPVPERPVRAQKIARFAARLAASIVSAPSGTRVVPPEVMWTAAQARDAAAFADAWLSDPPPPETLPPPSRP